MPVTHEDAAMFLHAMDQLGDSFTKNRVLKEGERRTDMERLLREKQLQPKVSAFIADPDNPAQGIGVEGSYEQIIDIQNKVKQAKGKAPLVMPKHPGAAKAYATVSTPVGNFTAYSEKEYNDLVNQLNEKKVPIGKPPPTLTPAKTSTGETVDLTPGGAVVRPDRSGYDTETTVYPKEDAVGAHKEGGFLGFGGTPVPAKPEVPERRVTRKVPRGTSVTSPPPNGTQSPTNTASPLSLNIEQVRADAQRAIARGKDPTAVRQKFREATGQDL